MALIEVKGYDVETTMVQKQIAPGFVVLTNGYVLVMDLGSGTVDFSGVDDYSAHALMGLKYVPEMNFEYSHARRAKERGLKPFGSVNYVSMDPKSVSSDKKLLSKLKKIAENGKKIEYLNCDHKEGEFDGFFELADGSRHNLVCAGTTLLSAMNDAVTKIKYRGEDVTDLDNNIDFKHGDESANIRLVMPSANAFLGLYLVYDMKSGVVKNAKNNLGLYTLNGLMNELALTERNGTGVAVKEIAMDLLKGDIPKAAVKIEKNGKLDMYDTDATDGIILSQLLGMPLYLDDKIIPKAPVPQTGLA